ncbi:Ig-like domain-containing protein, partial [Candidatus Woesearchaeota archaeon]|nr:Ig-like domain-containing protein [Candidatus Woesearchaeota archaeon]
FQPGFDFVIHPDRTEDITFQFRAYDGNRRTGWRGVPITVNDVNRLPQIISLPITVAQENVLYQYQVVAIDADPEDTLTYSLPTAPAGMTIDNDGLISWTPDFTQAGNHNVIVQVSDSIDVVRQSYTITVAPSAICVDGDDIAATGCICQVPLANVGGICTVPPTPICIDGDDIVARGCVCQAPLADVGGICTVPAAPICIDGDDIAATGCVCQAPLADVGGICTVPPAPVCVDGDDIAARGCVCQAPLIDVAGVCKIPPGAVLGCTDPAALNYNPAATVDDGSCRYLPGTVLGCMDPAALNYNPAATVDDGSCTYPPGLVCVEGDDIAAKGCSCRAPLADVNGICTVPVSGCTQPTATNFNPAANVDDGSCTFPPAPVVGCLDPRAINFDRRVTVDDGSCEYLRRGVVILSVHPSQEVVSAGDSVQFNVDVLNNADIAANRLQPRAMLYDLSEVGYGRQFDLRPGRTSSQAVMLNIPYGVWPGTYLVQITVDNGRVRDTAYRELVIN